MMGMFKEGWKSQEEEWNSLSHQPISTWFFSVGGWLTRLNVNYKQSNVITSADHENLINTQ